MTFELATPIEQQAVSSNNDEITTEDVELVLNTGRRHRHVEVENKIPSAPPMSPKSPKSPRETEARSPKRAAMSNNGEVGTPSVYHTPQPFKTPAGKSMQNHGRTSASDNSQDHKSALRPTSPIPMDLDKVRNVLSELNSAVKEEEDHYFMQLEQAESRNLKLRQSLVSSDDLRESNTALKKSLEEAQNFINTMRAEAETQVEALGESLVSRDAEIARIQEEFKSLTETLNEKNEEIEKIKQLNECLAGKDEHLAGKLQELQDALRDKDTQLEQLKAQSKEAMDEKEKLLTNVREEFETLRREYESVREEKEDIEQGHEEAKEKWKRLVITMKSEYDNFRASFDHLKASKKEMEEAHQQEKTKLEKRAAQLKKENGTLNASLDSLKIRKEVDETEHKDAQTKWEQHKVALEIETQSLQQDLENLQLAKADTEEKLAALQEQFEQRVKDTAGSAETLITTLQNDLKVAKGELNSIQLARDVLEQEKQELKALNATTEKERDALVPLKAKFEALSIEYDGKMSECTALATEIAGMKTAKEEIEKTFAAMHTEFESRKQELENVKTELVTTIKEKDVAQERVATLESEAEEKFAAFKSESEERFAALETDTSERIKSLQTEVSERTNELEGLKSAMLVLETEKADAEASFAETKQELEGKVESVQAEYDNLANNFDTLNTSIEYMKTSHAEERSRLDKKIAKLTKAVETKSEALSMALTKYLAEMKAKEKAEKDLESEKQYRVALDVLQQKYKTDMEAAAQNHKSEMEATEAKFGAMLEEKEAESKAKYHAEIDAIETKTSSILEEIKRENLATIEAIKEKHQSELTESKLKHQAELDNKEMLLAETKRVSLETIGEVEKKHKGELELTKQNHLAELEKTTKELTSELEEKKEELKTHVEIEEKYQTEITKLVANLEGAEKRVTALDDVIKFKNAEHSKAMKKLNDKLEESLQYESGKRESALTAQVESENKLIEMEKLVAKTEAEILATKCQADSLRETLQKAESGRQEAVEKCESLTRKLEETTRKMLAATTELDGVRSSFHNVKEGKADVEKRLEQETEQMKKTISALNKSVAKKIATITSMESQIESLQNSLDLNHTTENDATQKLDYLRELVSSKEKELELVKSRCDSLQTSLNQSEEELEKKAELEKNLATANMKVTEVSFLVEKKNGELQAIHSRCEALQSSLKKAEALYTEGVETIKCETERQQREALEEAQDKAYVLSQLLAKKEQELEAFKKSCDSLKASGAREESPESEASRSEEHKAMSNQIRFLDEMVASKDKELQLVKARCDNLQSSLEKMQETHEKQVSLLKNATSKKSIQEHADAARKLHALNMEIAQKQSKLKSLQAGEQGEFEIVLENGEEDMHLQDEVDALRIRCADLEVALESAEKKGGVTATGEEPEELVSRCDELEAALVHMTQQYEEECERRKEAEEVFQSIKQNPSDENAVATATSRFGRTRASPELTVANKGEKKSNNRWLSLRGRKKKEDLSIRTYSRDSEQRDDPETLTRESPSKWRSQYSPRRRAKDVGSTVSTANFCSNISNKDAILAQVPSHIKANFREVGFYKQRLQNSYLPVLCLGPFDVPPGPVRDEWVAQYKKGGKVLSLGVYFYGKEADDDEAYGMIPWFSFVPFSKAVNRGLTQIPHDITDKVEAGVELSAEEREIHDGLEQINVAAEQSKEARTHPLQNQLANDVAAAAAQDCVEDNLSLIHI